MTTSLNLDGSPDPRSFTSATDWIGGLQTLREQAHLSVRDLARRTGASSSTIGGYVSGRHLPNLAGTDLVERILLVCGIEDEAERQIWVDALHRVRRLPGPRPASSPAPFKGLAGYGVTDASWFYGREELTCRVVDLAEQSPDTPIILVGASGCGKSSLLAAGATAAMIEKGWKCSALTPGSEPTAAIERLVCEVAEHIAAGHRTVAVIDQLEELWTTDLTDPQRRSAISQLADLAARTDIVMLAALRADFYPKALSSPSLATALQTHQVVVGPMATDDLVRAITEPAHRAGLDVEEGLVDILLRDLAPTGRTREGTYEAGALPLLSYALLQTWQRGGRHRLTVSDYRATGGIIDAVAQAAESVVANLTEAEAALARRFFTRLVCVGDETSDTRRRLSHDELHGLGHPDPGHGPAPGRGIAEIVELFVAARLVTVGASTVEITHEALLTAWPRLQSWLDADRSGLLVHRRLAEAASAWDRGEKEPDLLLRGGHLESALERSQDPRWQASLNTVERSFLVESTAHRDRERQAARARTRRLRALAATLAVALLTVAGLAASGVRTRRTAEHTRDLALSRQLAEAANRLRVVDPTVAAQFALLGYRTAPTVEARSALIDTTAAPIARRLEGPGGPVAVASSRSGRFLAAAGDQGGVRLWTVDADGLPSPATEVLHAQDLPLYAVAADPPGLLLAAAGAGGMIHLWDTRDVGGPGAPRQLPPLRLDGKDTVLALTFRPDGGSLAAAVSGPNGALVHVWRVTRSRVVAHETATVDPGEPTVQTVGFSADGRVLATAGASGRITRWSMSGDRLRPLPPLTGATGTVTSLAFSPDGRSLAAGSKNQNLYLWRLPEAKAPAPSAPTVVPGAQSWVNVVAFSPDGGQLIAGSSDSHLRVYDAAALTIVADIGQPGPVTGGVYNTDGSAMVTGDADGRVRLWPLPLPQGGLAEGRTFGLAFLGTDRLLALTARNTTRIFDVARPFAARPVTGTFGAPSTDRGAAFAGTLAVSRNGRLFAAGGTDGTTWLYQVTQAQVAHAQVAHTQGGTAPTPVATLPKTQTSLIEAAAFTADGRTLVTSEDNSTLQVTDVTDPRRPRPAGRPLTTTGTVYALAGSPDGRIMASGTGATGMIQLWDTTRPGELHLRGRAPVEGSPTLQVYGLAFSPDGRTLAVGAADRSIRFLDISNAATPRWVGEPVLSAGDYIFSVQFSPDGKMLASASGDGVVRLYDLTDPATATPLAALTAPGRAAMYSVAFDPTGRRLAAGGTPESVHLWDLDPERAAQRVCDLAGEPIPHQEWQRYVPSVPFTPPCGVNAR